MSWLKKYYDDIQRGKTEVFIFKRKDRETGEPIYDYKEVQLLVGEEMHMILDNLIEDMENPEYRYDTSFSDTLIEFMEHCIRLTKSPFYNVPMKLMLWQKAWIEALFSFKMYDEEFEEWTDRFIETLLLIGRKNTKSETSSAICDSIFLIGGEGMDIVVASNTYDQAKILYEACDKMRMMVDPKSKDTWRNREGLTCLYNQNTIRTMSDRTRTKEGKNIDIGVVDEEHEMQDDSLVSPIIQSQSIKLFKKLIKLTTEGFTENGYLDEDLVAYRKIINREDDSISAKRKLPWLYTMNSESQVWNTNEKGINPAWQMANPTLIYGVKKWSYLRDQVDAAKKSKSTRAFVLSKDFNFKVSTGQAWLSKEDYDYEAVFDLKSFTGCRCLGAVDLSSTTDLTNAKIMLMRKDDNKKYIHSHYWITKTKLEASKDDKTSGAMYQEWFEKGLVTICDTESINLELVADWFQSLRTDYSIELLKCGYDRKFADTFIDRMEFYGWINKEDLIMIAQTPYVLKVAIDEVEAQLQAHLLVGLNDVDKWCFGNAALKVSSDAGQLIVKIDGTKTKRIDGAVTQVILQETFNRCWNEFKLWLK